jgi:tryptophan-rich sensory protein
VASRPAADSDVSFFQSLVKPSWIPPDWVFPTVWFSLWALQGFALIRLLGASTASPTIRRIAIGMMIAQFVAAVAWEALIFGPGRLRLAAVWLTIVLILVIVAVAAAGRVDRLAALLVAPTLVWVSVATVLGWSLYRLNPTALTQTSSS